MTDPLYQRQGADDPEAEWSTVTGMARVWTARYTVTAASEDEARKYIEAQARKDADATVEFIRGPIRDRGPRSYWRATVKRVRSTPEATDPTTEQRPSEGQTGEAPVSTGDPIVLNVLVNDPTFDPETEEVVQYPGEAFPRIRTKASQDITIDTEVGPLVARIGETLLYQYPEGDVDRVVLVAAPPLTAADQVDVRLPDGRLRLVDPAMLSSLRPDPEDLDAHRAAILSTPRSRSAIAVASEHFVHGGDVEASAVIVEGLAELAQKPVLKTREQIEAAGYAPGWNGQFALVGDVVVINGHNGWRRAIATKVTPTIVHAVFTTPTNVEQARRIHADVLANDPLRARTAVRKQELGNWDFYESQVKAGPDRYDQPGQHARYIEHVAEGREAFADRKADEAAEKVRSEARFAEANGWQAYVTVTKGQGRRDGRKTDLYIMRGTIPENAL